uniref:Uncharacterized protein n=1 Tax=Bursaphelenchus xylophilus TaxID=6326 RepID=A0A1I7S1C1_BURXY
MHPEPVGTSQVPVGLRPLQRPVVQPSGLSSSSAACRPTQRPIVLLSGLSSNPAAYRPAQRPVILLSGLSTPCDLSPPGRTFIPRPYNPLPSDRVQNQLESCTVMPSCCRRTPGAAYPALRGSCSWRPVQGQLP